MALASGGCQDKAMTWQPALQRLSLTRKNRVSLPPAASANPLRNKPPAASADPLRNKRGVASADLLKSSLCGSANGLALSSR